MSSNTNEYSHLSELGKSNYEVAAGESDIRNWVVKNENGNILGEVRDLIFDSRLRKVVFIVLDLDRNELNLKERVVLIPIEYADIHEAYKNVVVKGLMPNELATLPTYEKGKITGNSLDLTMSTFIASKNTNVSPPQNSSGNSPTSSQVYNDPSVQNTGMYTRENSNGLKSSETGYSVVGVFDHARPIQAAVEYLLEHGYRREQITVSSRQAEVEHERTHRDESGITQFFRNMFSSDDEARRYSDAAGQGSVISVDVDSRERAEEAARILDEHGSLDLNAAQHTAGSLKGNSRIFERRSGR